MKSVLRIKEKQFLTPHYIRLILEGDDIGIYKDARVGDNNKIALPENGVVELPENGMPQGVIRTYTMRALELDKGEMTLDFVAHGEEGPASRWALNCKEGDPLGVLMKEKTKPLFKPADYYLLVGDHTALPVISVILEQLPDDAKGKAILEVYAKEDRLELIKPDGVEVVWVFNERPGEEVLLPQYFEQETIPAGQSRYIYAAAEYQSVRQIQEQIRSYDFIDRSEWQSYAYWKFGQAENKSAQNRGSMAHRG